MKSILTIALFFSFALPAFAFNWTPSGENKVAKVFIDHGTIRQIGKPAEIATVWTLIDMKAPDAKNPGVKSVKTQFQFDCTGERYRIAAQMQFNGNMAKGTMIEHATEAEIAMQQFKPVDGGMEKMMETACGDNFMGEFMNKLQGEQRAAERLFGK